jgi:hypothetical protein
VKYAFFLTAAIWSANFCHAADFSASGDNGAFKMSVEFDKADADNSRLDGNNAKLKSFRFEYDPKKLSWTPMGIYLRTVFGSRPMLLTERDVTVEKSGYGVAAATEDASGEYVALKLNNPSLMRGYRALAVQVGRWGKDFGFSNVQIFEGNLSTAQYFLHLAVIGRQYYRGSILQCDTLLTKAK